MPAKRPPTSYRLVPDAVRKRFVTLTVHFDFFVRKERLEQFRDAWKASAPRSPNNWGPFSDKADPSVGLQILQRRERETGESYHAIVEFRKGSSSPYPKISSRRMQRFVDRLRQHAERIEVASLRQTAEIEEPGLEEDRDFGKFFADVRETPDGYRARFTGFSMSFEKRQKPPVCVDFSRRGKVVRLSVSTKGLRFATLEDLFDTEKVTIALPGREATSAQEGEPQNAPG
jgi:hypothetical protein